MLKIENVDIHGWEAAIRGARNPLNSWKHSDTSYGTGEPFQSIGPNDLRLLRNLANAGPDHGKFLRMINVTADITGPLYWYKQFDAYKIGTVTNSCSTMHRLTHKPFELSDFSFDQIERIERKPYTDIAMGEEDYAREEWRTIEGHPKYAVSNYGNIVNVKSQRVLKQCVNSSGYKKVVLNKENEYVHRLVATAFISNPDCLPEVNHKDGNKWNNRVDNLEWVSKSDNAKHAFAEGLRCVNGYTRYRVAKSAHRFDAGEIAAIRNMYDSGMTKQEISEALGCCSSVICNILNGHTYREIEMESFDVARVVVDYLNELRDKYLETNDKTYWWSIVQLLPSSYNQKRTVQVNYAVLKAMYHARRNHKLDEWHTFCDWVETLPYFVELIQGKKSHE